MTDNTYETDVKHLDTFEADIKHLFSSRKYEKLCNHFATHSYILSIENVSKFCEVINSVKKHTTKKYTYLSML